MTDKKLTQEEAAEAQVQTELETAQARVTELKNAQAKACLEEIKVTLEKFNCFQDVAYTEPPTLEGSKWIMPTPVIVVMSR